MTATTMTRSRPAGDGRWRTAEDHLLRLATTSEDEQAREEELARRAVRRLAGGDVTDLLDALGLTPQTIDEPAAPTDKRCSTCQERKPTAEFYPRLSARDGLCSQCKACRNDTKRRSVQRQKESAA
jgi:hypothetical protein